MNLKQWVKLGSVALALGALVLIVPEVVQAQSGGGACYSGGHGSACGGVPDSPWIEAFLVLIIMYLMPGGSLISWT